jgi:hypothetical protein
MSGKVTDWSSMSLIVICCALQVQYTSAFVDILLHETTLPCMNLTVLEGMIMVNETYL